MRTLLILLAWTLSSGTCAAADVQLHVEREPRPWDDYPESIGQPVARWTGNALHVRYVANETATMIVSDRAPAVLATPSALALCYNTEPVALPNGQPALAWTGPVLLEFVVVGIPQRDYAITVRKGCEHAPAG